MPSSRLAPASTFLLPGEENALPQYTLRDCKRVNSRSREPESPVWLRQSSLDPSKGRTVAVRPVPHSSVFEAFTVHEHAKHAYVAVRVPGGKPPKTGSKSTTYDDACVSRFHPIPRMSASDGGEHRIHDCETAPHAQVTILQSVFGNRLSALNWSAGEWPNRTVEECFNAGPAHQLYEGADSSTYFQDKSGEWKGFLPIHHDTSNKGTSKASQTAEQEPWSNWRMGCRA